ncbi:hypothetical protein ARMGADRAFT_1079675 [Armillaria gallica]|uniref:Uncharacterized protein n=1 Tax=Armillaria gallica TaxID=47427 RepID=A0A2H3DPD6_ARMGA|nr:hypothetical protein ARMGADRAFT_1079675 [Armillaria gallica]
MAEPTNPAELAVVAAQDRYNAAAAMIDNLLDNFPNLTWDSMSIDTWITDILNYNLDVVPLPVCCALAKHSKATASPSQSHQDAATTGSRVVMPAPLPLSSKTTTPIPLAMETWAIEPSMAKHMLPLQNVRSSVPCLNLLAASPNAPSSNTLVPAKSMPSNQLQTLSKPSTSTSGSSKRQVTQPPSDPTTGVWLQMTQRKVKPMPITAGSADVAFSPNPTLPLHQQPGTLFNFGWPPQATWLEASLKSSLLHLLTVDAATHPSVIPGPDPAHKGSVDLLLGVCEPLFFPSTDDEEEQVWKDLVEDDDEPRLPWQRQHPKLGESLGN